jgi:hypothetical protein
MMLCVSLIICFQLCFTLCFTNALHNAFHHALHYISYCALYYTIHYYTILSSVYPDNLRKVVGTALHLFLTDNTLENEDCDDIQTSQAARLRSLKQDLGDAHLGIGLPQNSFWLMHNSIHPIRPGMNEM